MRGGGGALIDAGGRCEPVEDYSGQGSCNVAVGCLGC